MTLPQPKQDEALAQLITRARDESPTAEEMVIAVIRSAVADGLFPPGERLPQDRLAGLLRVSRTPIRSALRQLESEGLVVVHANRGATVRSLSPDEISDLHEMRILIETFALSKTVTAITPAEMEDLDRLADKLEMSDPGSAWNGARETFYRALYSIGNTPRVVATIMQFQAEVGRYTTDLARNRTHAHRDLLDRVRIGDPDLAAAWLVSHLREVARALQDRIVEHSETNQGGSQHG